MTFLSVTAYTFQISHARRAGKPYFSKYWAMWSGSIIGDSGEIKGVALWLLVRPFLMLKS